MAETYVARKRLKVGDEWREPGEPIPEAATWRNLHSYLSSGAVMLVQTDVVQATANKQRVPLEPEVKDWEPDPPASYKHAHDQTSGWGSPDVVNPTKTLRIKKTAQKKD